MTAGAGGRPDDTIAGPTTGATDAPVVSERIRRARNSLAPAELRVVAALLEDYPIAGLGSIGQLAAKAEVSAPTVLRLLAKLGFTGYSAFREQLRTEVQARLFTPIQAYPAGPDRGSAPDPASGPARAEKAFGELVPATFRGLDQEEFAAAGRALADLDRTLLVTGGRFSQVVATHLSIYLQTLRPGVHEVPAEAGARARALLSAGPTTTVVAFDFRRYQNDTVEFAVMAARRGAQILLVTDPFLSPLAPTADVVLTAAVGGAAPFDSLVGAVMLSEALVSSVATELGETARDRLADFEEHVNGADPDVMARLRPQPPT